MRNRILQVCVAILLWGSLAASVLAHVSDTSLLRIQIRRDSLAVDWNTDLLTLQKIVSFPSDPAGGVAREDLLAASPRIQEWLRSHVALSFSDSVPDLGTSAGVEWQSDARNADSGSLQSTHVNLHFERPWAKGEVAFHLSAAGLLQELGPKHNLIVALIQGNSSEQTVLTTEFPAIDYDPKRTEAKEMTGGEQSSFRALFSVGVEHILPGYDHLLFLATLLVVALSWRRMIGLVTAFTVAHGVSLGLAVYGVLRVPEKVVECAIAGSIAWVAVENLTERRLARRWGMTFAFGLVHGLGFAGALRAMELPREGLFRSVLYFNLGVEVGQLAFVFALLPLLWIARGSLWEVRVNRLISGIALVLALVWLGQRLAN